MSAEEKPADNVQRLRPVTLDALGEKTDTAITDVRALGVRVSSAIAVAAEARSAAQGAALAAGEARDAACGLSLDLADVSAAVVETQISVGREPDPALLARATSNDLSPKEVAALDAAAKFGTGLHRRISLLEIKVLRRAALGAMLGIGIVDVLRLLGPYALDALRALF